MAAIKTHKLPTQATNPRLKIPRWCDNMSVPNPIVVVKAARITPLAVLKGRSPGRIPP